MSECLNKIYRPNLAAQDFKLISICNIFKWGVVFFNSVHIIGGNSDKVTDNVENKIDF